MAPPTREAAFARRLIAERREREAMLGRDLFGEPAWDLLLELFAAHDEGRDVPLSALSRAGGVPVSTSLRWIAALGDEGKLVRLGSPSGGEREYVRLSAGTVDRMRGLLRSWIGAAGSSFSIADRVRLRWAAGFHSRSWSSSCRLAFKRSVSSPMRAARSGGAAA